MPLRCAWISNWSPAILRDELAFDLEVQFNKNIVVTSEITGVVEGLEDHNAVNVKQLSEVVAVDKQQVANQLLATFNTITKELRNEINTAKIKLDTEKSIMVQFWLQKRFYTILYIYIIIMPKQNGNLLIFFCVSKHETTSWKSIFFHFFHIRSKQPDKLEFTNNQFIPSHDGNEQTRLKLTSYQRGKQLWFWITSKPQRTVE